MSRVISPEAESAVSAGHVVGIILVAMDFPDGALRVNNSPVNFRWNGHDWIGLGRLGGIDSIKEGASLEARGLSFRLSGVPTENISIALNQQYQGRDCDVWYAPLNPTTHAVLADPVKVFWGRLDVMNIEWGRSATITVTAESRLIDWARPRVRRYNHDDQQIDFPGDLGFNFIPSIVEKELRWG